jgi:hypothetical protein
LLVRVVRQGRLALAATKEEMAPILNLHQLLQLGEEVALALEMVIQQAIMVDQVVEERLQ